MAIPIRIKNTAFLLFNGFPPLLPHTGTAAPPQGESVPPDYASPFFLPSDSVPPPGISGFPCPAGCLIQTALPALFLILPHTGTAFHTPPLPAPCQAGTAPACPPKIQSFPECR